MLEPVTSTSNEIAHAANVKFTAVATNSTVATGLVVTGEKPEIAGTYLITHFIGPLSYLEVIQVIGAISLIVNLSILAYKQLSSIYRSVKNGQQAGQ